MRVPSPPTAPLHFGWSELERCGVSSSHAQFRHIQGGIDRGTTCNLRLYMMHLFPDGWSLSGGQWFQSSITG